MRMFNSRKGVSEVVANVLIVLLVIVGIAVIWSVVKPTIDKGAQGIQTGSDCLGLSVEAVSCSYNSTTNPSSAKIKRNAGAGTIESLELVFTDGSGASKVYSYTVPLTTPFGELSTIDVTAPLTNVGGLAEPTSGSVSVSIGVKSGGQVCPVVSQPVTCT